jgi:hypothetical protein
LYGLRLPQLVVISKPDAKVAPVGADTCAEQQAVGAEETPPTAARKATAETGERRN